MSKIKSTGRNGPAPRPAHLKIISGTDRGDRVIHEAVSLADNIEPEKPESLSGDEIAEWDKVIIILRNTGLLSASDSAIIAAYCVAKCAFQHSSEAIESANRGLKNAFGLLTLSAQKTPIANPLLSIRSRASSDMTSYAIQLGLTPASRLKLNAEVAQKKANPFDVLKEQMDD